MTRTRDSDGNYAATSPHHGDEQMLCAACRTPWPCEPFRRARAAKPFGPLNIPVPPPFSKKVSG